jgi:hypothetical protein
VLSELAALPLVHVLATVDTLHAPLLVHDHTRWLWVELHTASRYLDEILFAEKPATKRNEKPKGAAVVRKILAQVSHKTVLLFFVLARQIVLQDAQRVRTSRSLAR